MADNYTQQIISIFNGDLDIRKVSEEAIELFIELYPYSPYGHLIKYLKAKIDKNSDANELLNRLATYSPDRAWLQEVLNTSLKELTYQDSTEAIPSAAKSDDVLNTDFEFEFRKSVQEVTTIQASEQIEKLDAEDEESVIESKQSVPVKKTIKEVVSYTEWLKTLKIKVDQTLDEARITEEPVIKKDVYAVPDSPNTRKDDDLFGGIITETLAGLLANQGQSEKAIAMYAKLSLIFPEKSSFFAGKIAELKRNKS